ncbi:STAS domain-containing protein [Paractinoplanes atraurantiacus]|uniref:STAS domain-containing protein n=1 Tax=Paractinoplanes atraurantiacus TaxID=1036182 RepID=UPI0034DB3A22
MLELIADVMRHCPGDVVVDMSGLTFIDVGGLRVFALTSSALRAYGRRLWLAGCPRPIRRLIGLLGWEDILQEAPGGSHQQGGGEQDEGGGAAAEHLVGEAGEQGAARGGEPGDELPHALDAAEEVVGGHRDGPGQHRGVPSRERQGQQGAESTEQVRVGGEGRRRKRRRPVPADAHEDAPRREAAYQ